MQETKKQQLVGWGCRIHQQHLCGGVRLLQHDPVGWGCRIHQLHLCRGVRLPPNECPGYNINPSEGKATVLEFWEM